MLEYITYFVVFIYSAISVFFDVSFFAEVNETLMIIVWRVGFVLFIPTVILLIVLAVIASSDKRSFVISKPGLCDALIISSWILIGVFLFCLYTYKKGASESDGSAIAVLCPILAFYYQVCLNPQKQKTDINSRYNTYTQYTLI